MVEQRRLDVLRAIVEDYVRLQEPVGSRALIERHHFDVSSATIRNDMAALEEEGLIEAPHTSAGRVPTDKGYRTFVDRITEVKPLSSAERRAIHGVLEGSADVDEILDRTTRTLAQLTGQVALAQYPTSATTRVRHVEFVAVSDSRALCILITDTGKVEQSFVELASDTDAEELSCLRESFLRQLVGVPLATLPLALETLSQSVQPGLRPLTLRLCEALQGAAKVVSQQRVVVAGIANLARSSHDFPLSIGPILDALEEQVVMLKLLSEMVQDSRGLGVSIGSEHCDDSLSHTAVVASPYAPGSGAKLGILGPTRMDYPSTMAAVRAIASYISKILTTSLTPDEERE